MFTVVWEFRKLKPSKTPSYVNKTQDVGRVLHQFEGNLAVCERPDIKVLNRPQTIRVPEFGLGDGTLEHRQLLAQGKILLYKLLAQLEAGALDTEDRQNHMVHGRTTCPTSPKNQPVAQVKSFRYPQAALGLGMCDLNATGTARKMPIRVTPDCKNRTQTVR